LLGREAGPRLFDDFRIVHPHAELAATARFDERVEAGRLLDGSRRTGGSRFVISNHAVADLDARHATHHKLGSEWLH